MRCGNHPVNAKLEEADVSPDYFCIVPILPGPQVLEVQDNSDKPKGVGDNVMLEAVVSIIKLND